MFVNNVLTINRTIKLKNYLTICVSIAALYFSACSSSQQSESDDKYEHEQTKSEVTTGSSEAGVLLMNTAKSEQQNKMYSRESDSVYLYWTNEYISGLAGNTKCNVFALNVLYDAGFLTPSTNALCRDLFDTNNYRDVLPFISEGDINKAERGDLIISQSHVLIFESQEFIGDKLYVRGWWAGTRQEDDGQNIINNVCHGKYDPGYDFIIRRPLKKEVGK